MSELTLTFEGHVPSKKNHGRSVTRGGRVFHVPSAAHEAWRKTELLSLIEALPGCKFIAAQINHQVNLTLNPDHWSDTDTNNLAKGMREHPAIYPPPYALEYEFYPGSLASWDLSNSVESLNDLLVDARLIQDDSWHYLRATPPRIAGFSDGEECCIVHLHCLPPGPADDALAALKDKTLIKALAQRKGITQKLATQQLRTMLAEGLARRSAVPLG
jgi:hypothetical protein